MCYSCMAKEDRGSSSTSSLGGVLTYWVQGCDLFAGPNCQSGSPGLQQVSAPRTSQIVHLTVCSKSNERAFMATNAAINCSCCPNPSPPPLKDWAGWSPPCLPGVLLEQAHRDNFMWIMPPIKPAAVLQVRRRPISCAPRRAALS
jgi:hypothetical protein